MPEERVSETEGLRTYEADRSATVRMCGVWLDAVRFLERNQICDVNLWRVFVDLFRTGADDADGKWRCEYLGKMMRGAAMVLQSRIGCRDYTQSYRYLPDGGMEPRPEAGEDRMYLILKDTVRDLLSTADREGQITTYRANAFTGWDLWGRKYVMLGLGYFLGICRLRARSTGIVMSPIVAVPWCLPPTAGSRIPTLFLTFCATKPA